MNLDIVNVDLGKTRMIGRIGETEIIAYWIKFRNNEISSEAYILPYNNDVNRLECKTISVETSQSSIGGLRKLKDNSLFSPKVKIQNDESYIVIGRIDFIEFEDFEDENSPAVVANVDVSGITFIIDQCDADISDLAIGDWVEFQAENLLLFDEGI